MSQFTCNGAMSRELMALLFDAQKRHETIRGMSARVKGSQKKMDDFGWLCETETFKRDLKEALADPKGSTAQRILKQVMPIMNFAARKTSYGALERNAAVTKICELSKRYGAAWVFLTIS